MAQTPRLIAILPKRVRPYAVQLRKPLGKAKRRFERFIRKFFPKKEVEHPMETLLNDAHEKLLTLWKRQYSLEAIDIEWLRITQGRSYRIHDEAVFQMVMDTASMNIIDLTSWGIGMYDAGVSLLTRVRNQYLNRFPAARQKKPEESSPSNPELTELMDCAHAEARSRLFPNADSRALTSADGQELIDRFKTKVAALRDDRNKNRAHAYENRTHGSATPLNVAEVRSCFTMAQELLNDLSLVAGGSTWSENDLNSNDAVLAAEDVVDIVLLPNSFRRLAAASGLSRKEMHDAIQNASNSANSANSAKFNDIDGLKAIAKRFAPQTTPPPNGSTGLP
jgi:hypothetical protein